MKFLFSGGMICAESVNYDFMRKISFVIFILLEVFLSCSKKTTSFVGKSIVGNWQWINSVGGFTGHDTLKPNLDTSVILILAPDHTYKRTLNGQITAQGSYDLISVESIYGKSKREAIRFDNFATNDGLIINLDEPNLTLSDNHVEPYTHFYKRLK